MASFEVWKKQTDLAELNKEFQQAKAELTEKILKFIGEDDKKIVEDLQGKIVKLLSALPVPSKRNGTSIAMIFPKGLSEEIIAKQISEIKNLNADQEQLERIREKLPIQQPSPDPSALQAIKILYERTINAKNQLSSYKNFIVPRMEKVYANCGIITQYQDIDALRLGLPLEELRECSDQASQVDLYIKRFNDEADSDDSLNGTTIIKEYLWGFEITIDGLTSFLTNLQHDNMHSWFLSYGYYDEVIINSCTDQLDKFKDPLINIAPKMNSYEITSNCTFEICWSLGNCEKVEE